MNYNTRIFEMKRTVIKQSSVLDMDPINTYISLNQEKIWPELRKIGGRVNCILQGLIGDSPNELLQVTEFPDIESYRNLHLDSDESIINSIEEQSVTLFRNITPRPNFPFPDEDRRTVYTNRKFFINSKDIELYAELSYDKVWPLYEKWGCSVLGLFTPITKSDHQEIRLITGYKSVAHWEETRAIMKPRPDYIEKKVWDEGVEAVLNRAGRTFKTTVSIMSARYLDGD